MDHDDSRAADHDFDRCRVVDMTPLALHLPALAASLAGPLVLVAIAVIVVAAALHDPYRGLRR